MTDLRRHLGTKHRTVGMVPEREIEIDKCTSNKSQQNGIDKKEVCKLHNDDSPKERVVRHGSSDRLRGDDLGQAVHVPDGGVHAPEGGGHRGPDDVHGRKAAAGHGLAEAAQLVVEGVDARQDQVVLVGEDVVEIVDGHDVGV